MKHTVPLNKIAVLNALCILPNKKLVWNTVYLVLRGKCHVYFGQDSAIQSASRRCNLFSSVKQGQRNLQGRRMLQVSTLVTDHRLRRNRCDGHRNGQERCGSDTNALIIYFLYFLLLWKESVKIWKCTPFITTRYYNSVWLVWLLGRFPPLSFLGESSQLFHLSGNAFSLL